MDTLSLYIMTWNLAEQMPPSDLNLTELLSLDRKEDCLPDLYIIGLQEAKVDLITGQWGAAFKNLLKQFKYIEMNSIRLLGIVMYVFSREQHITKIRNMETGSTATGLLGIIGNKGAVTLRLDLYGVSVCFVNSHLAAHDGHLEDRINSYNIILASQKFKLNPETTSIFFHDYVFWYGDLNFRLEGDKPQSELSAAVTRGELSELFTLDELSRVRANGAAFSELQEQTPTFEPTYKHEFGKTQYNTSRRLAWTDRVLYKANKDAYQNVTLDVTQTSYRSFPTYTVSDHKPVCAEFNIKVFSHHSDREVTFSLGDTWYLDEENTANCHLPADVNPSIWDWVGVFQDELTNLQDYVSYIYLPHQREEQSDKQPGNVTVTLRFPTTAVREPGLYRLLYFTRGATSLLGISPPFSAVHRDDHTPSFTGTSGQLFTSTDLGISTNQLLLTILLLMLSYYLNLNSL